MPGFLYAQVARLMPFVAQVLVAPLIGVETRPDRTPTTRKIHTIKAPTSNRHKRGRIEKAHTEGGALLG